MRTNYTHTPGPWVPVKTARAVIDGRGCRLAALEDMPGQDAGERAGNARLIAAAPELLEACRAVIDAWERGNLSAAANQCAAAIAKVERGEG